MPCAYLQVYAERPEWSFADEFGLYVNQDRHWSKAFVIGQPDIS